MSDWGAPDVKEWKKEARAQQQDMFLLLGNRKWDKWEKSNETILYRKIGFAMFSLPEHRPRESNDFTGYKKKQLAKIKLVADAIERNAKSGDNIYFACIFIFGKIWEKRFNIPVFKVKGRQKQTLFVDTDCRVYPNWQDYLDSNCLPKCMYCYPRDGLYHGEEGHVFVDFGTSPACDLSNRMRTSLDNTATAVNFIVTPVLVYSIFGPVYAPLLVAVETAAALAAIYQACRKAEEIVDRWRHDQSISPTDREALIAWLQIAGCALGLAQTGILKSITRQTAAGRVPSTLLRVAYNVITVGKLTVNGLGNLNNLITLIHKAEEGTLTTLDVYHFTLGVLFFANNLINVTTAQEIIENAQRSVFEREFSSREMEELFRRSEEMEGEALLDRNANIIRRLNRIDNTEDFYESLVTDSSDL